MFNILFIGVVTFACSTLYFTLKPKKGFNSAFLVSLVTLISYIVMLQGNYVTNDNYWTRWLGYGISCPLLAYEISNRIKLSLDKTIFNTFLTAIVMISGAFASLSVGNYRLLLFGVSTFAFIALITQMYKQGSSKLKNITPYILFGWSVFPIVFILSNEGLLPIVSVTIAAIIYLALDIFTKIVFYIHHSKVD
jgi:bacteriorhodopsin